MHAPLDYAQEGAIVTLTLNAPTSATPFRQRDDRRHRGGLRR
jgi:hypothetical protein